MISRANQELNWSYSNKLPGVQKCQFNTRLKVDFKSSYKISTSAGICCSFPLSYEEQQDKNKKTNSRLSLKATNSIFIPAVVPNYNVRLNKLYKEINIKPPRQRIEKSNMKLKISINWQFNFPIGGKNKSKSKNKIPGLLLNWAEQKLLTIYNLRNTLFKGKNILIPSEVLAVSLLGGLALLPFGKTKYKLLGIPDPKIELLLSFNYPTKQIGLTFKYCDYLRNAKNKQDVREKYKTLRNILYNKPN